jgi:hypothetical protein
MRRILFIVTLVILVSFRPVSKKENAVFSPVTLTYGNSSTPGCYGVFMYNYDDATEYFFTFSGSYGTLGPVTSGNYFVSINEITPYCDGYHNRTFQVGCATEYNSGTQVDFYDIPINSSCSYIFVV